MGPIDYSIDVATPFQSAAQGYQLGAGIRNDQFAQQQQQLALQQAQQQQQVLRALMANPNPTADDYARATLAVPGMREHFKQSWDMHNSDQQQSLLTELGQVHAALANGQPQFAVDLLNRRADALANSGGDPQQIQAARDMAKVAETHPEFAKTLTGMKLATLPGGDKIFSTLATAGQESRAAAAAPAELATKRAEAVIKTVEAGAAPEKVSTDIANVKGQIDDRVKRFGLDQDKLTTETQLKLKELGLQYGTLPASVGEAVSTATTDAIASEQSASRMTDLANRIEQAGMSSGGVAKGAELLKKVTGNQNEVTRMRAEYSRLVTPAAMAAYKKVASGSTSDKDIDTAMTGVPPDTADPDTMAAFLRGAAKLQVYDSVMNNAKSEWLGAVRNLGKAQADIEVDGVKVPAGTTFKDFVDQYVPAKVADRIGAMTVQGRSYMRFAEPPQQGGASGTF
jgi:hypothetical protein